MAFTGKFTRFHRYLEGNATDTQGEAEKDKNLYTGKNLANLTHSCSRYLLARLGRNQIPLKKGGSWGCKKRAKKVTL